MKYNVMHLNIIVIMIINNNNDNNIIVDIVCTSTSIYIVCLIYELCGCMTENEEHFPFIVSGKYSYVPMSYI